MPINPEINIEKSRLPIIWLDTSIITVMTQWKLGLCNLEQVQEQRIRHLYNSIYQNVASSKLICPLAEQETEVWRSREEWLETVHTLTLGIETQTQLDIYDKQIYYAMQAYVAGENTINLSYLDVFYDDPVGELNEAHRSGVYFTIRRDIIYAGDHPRDTRRLRNTLSNQAREKNVRNSVTFEQQLEEEYRAMYRTLGLQASQFIATALTGGQDDPDAFAGMLQLGKYLHYWERCSGNANDLQGLERFFNSPYHKNLPYPFISCNLSARLMTSNQPIRSGDFIDMEHASSLFPYVNLFITDRAMRTYLRSQNLDTLYDTTACYIGDTDEINEFFSNL